MPTTSATKSPTKDTDSLVATKRAFAYLRVSSDGQVQTGFSSNGLSIDGQREAADTKAAELHAEIVRRWPALGKTAFVPLHKRPDFLEMLDELKRCNERKATHIDYVIVWATDRWARDVRAHFDAHDLVREAGARLVSITEPMIGEDTPESFYFEGMKAVSNQYESMRISRRVKVGIHQKAKQGGSYGRAPLGYLNDVADLGDGRRVAVVTIDPERGHYVTLAFQLYATGEYSLPQLAAELERLGLRSRPTRRWPSTPLGSSVVQRLLRNPYYIGLIPYKRGTPDEKVFEGRHESLIDQDTFDKVQALLDVKRVAGERPRARQHYLRGSVYCGESGERLAYALSTGRNGQRYAYYFCIGRVNGSSCDMRTNIRPELIEQAIQRYYVEHPIQLSAKDVQQRTEAIEALAAVSQEALAQVQRVKTELIAKLEANQDKLVDMRFEERSISASVFKRRQAKLEQELQAAHDSLAETEQRLTINANDLKMALELAEDVAQVYAAADEQTKRGYNQAFFKKLYVIPEWDEDGCCTLVKIVSVELTEPYALLLRERFAEEVIAEAEAITAHSATNTKRTPGSQTSPLKPFAQGVSYYELMAGIGGQPSKQVESSYNDHQAEGEGFEPSSEV